MFYPPFSSAWIKCSSLYYYYSHYDSLSISPKTSRANFRQRNKIYKDRKRTRPPNKHSKTIKRRDWDYASLAQIHNSNGGSIHPCWWILEERSLTGLFLKQERKRRVGGHSLTIQDIHKKDLSFLQTLPFFQS